jgi:hypothetical protein
MSGRIDLTENACTCAILPRPVPTPTKGVKERTTGADQRGRASREPNLVRASLGCSCMPARLWCSRLSAHTTSPVAKTATTIGETPTGARVTAARVGRDRAPPNRRALPSRVPTVRLSPDALAGFDAAAVRVLNRREPGLRWQSLRDDADPSGEGRTPAGDDDGVERAAQQLAEIRQTGVV